MFKIDNEQTIHITRGDSGCICVFAEDEKGHDYMFKPDEKLRFKVTEKKNTSNVVLEKTVTITQITTSVNIILEKEDTKIGDFINKPTDYWYEIELNPDSSDVQTIVGYDEDGPKLFTLYPEGGDSNA